MTFSVTYQALLLVITLFWLAVRAAVWVRQKQIRVRREIACLAVYVCIAVVVRFTFFPFSKVDGQIAPLILDTAVMFPPRVNFMPFVYLFDYPTQREILLNLIGNTAMFVPLGIVWPTVFRALNTPAKAIAAGFCTSLCIEVLQLPFHDRVSDIDDLILNTAGYLCGYALYLAVRSIKRTIVRTQEDPT